MMPSKIVLGLQILLLSCFTRGDDASVFIDGGPTVNEGDAVTIQCSYTGDISYRAPNFRINGVNYSSDSLSESLPFYQHHYQFVTIGEAYYNLTLAEVQMSHNGTTHQCFFNDGDIVSNAVTLIVIGSTTTEPRTTASTTAEPTTEPTTGGSTRPTSGTIASDQPRDEKVTITISSGDKVLVGGIVRIRCQYVGEQLAFNLPSFVIDSKTIRGEDVEIELPDYEHKNSVALKDGKWTATYTLTLKEAKMSHNNTVYQCFSEITKGRNEKFLSEKVTLSVIDLASLQTPPTSDPVTRACAGGSEVSLWLAVLLPIVCVIVIVVSAVVVGISVRIAIKATKESQRVKEEKSKVFPYVDMSSSPKPRGVRPN